MAPQMARYHVRFGTPRHLVVFGTVAGAFSMITDIPTADEFHAAGINQIYLAWQIIIQTVVDFEEATDAASAYVCEDVEAASAIYWQKAQPVLANALSLVQQAMEMALKGRIAAISPYLLIARDPREWPAKVDTEGVPFSEFRTLDASDLVKVHNTFAASPFDDEFKAFWEKVRRDRNKLMHSVSTQKFDAAYLIKTVLTAVEMLFSDLWWPKRLLAMEADDKYAAYGFGGGYEHNIVMRQVDMAMKRLEPADKKRFFGFEKRRAYVCPSCWQSAERDWGEDWPHLAQLSSKVSACTTLRCIICVETTEIERSPCHNQNCKGDVIFQNKCLTCLWEQDDPETFRSDLECSDIELSNRYSFDYRSETMESSCQRYILNDESAIEYSRLSMEAPHLEGWKSVTVIRDFLSEIKLVGTWKRIENGLVWQPAYRPPIVPPPGRGTSS